MNVFSGKNALKDFYNPDKCPPLPLVELPRHRFEDDGVEIYAKMLTLLPAGALPRLNVLLSAVENGETNETIQSTIEWPSVHTPISMEMISKNHDLGDFPAYMSSKDPKSRMQSPQFSNAEAHIPWIGQQLQMQMPDMAVFAEALGTTGTITGTGVYLKSVNPEIVNVGVFMEPGDKVPGPPPLPFVPPSWKDVIDEVNFATSVESYQTSLELSRHALLVGPSSGLTLAGLCGFLDKEKAAGRLKRLRGEDGKIKCVFICSDQPFQCLSECFDKMPPIPFPYCSAWTITRDAAYQKVKAQGAIVLDLRDQVDFDARRVAGSICLDLRCKNDLSPALRPWVLRRQWMELDRRLSQEDSEMSAVLTGKVVVINSYDRPTSEVASAILRKKGVEAYGVLHGFDFQSGDRSIFEYGRSTKSVIQVTRIDFESGKQTVFEYKRPSRSGIRYALRLQ